MFAHYGHQQDLHHTWLPNQKKKCIIRTRKYLVTQDRRGCKEMHFNITTWLTRKTREGAFGLGKSKGLRMIKKVFWLGIKNGSKIRQNSVFFYKLLGEKAPNELDLLQEDLSETRTLKAWQNRWQLNLINNQWKVRTICVKSRMLTFWPHACNL